MKNLDRALACALVVALAWGGTAHAQGPRKLTLQAAFPSAVSVYAMFEDFLARVTVMSGGTLELEGLPGGAIVPSFEVLDATARGVLDGGWTGAAYHLGKNRAAMLFGPTPGGPFGFDVIDHIGWIYDGGGDALLQEFYREVIRRDVVVIPFVPAGNQPLGWFNREIRGLDDLADLKCRATGVGGELLAAAGMKTVNLPGGEILAAAERGIIDCTEWAGPAADLSMGFHQVWHHYYLQSAHEPATVLQLVINGEVWRSLSAAEREIIRTAAMAINLRTQFITHRENAEALARYRAAGVDVRPTPPDITAAQLAAWEDIMRAESEVNPFFRKVLASQRAYAAKVVPARLATSLNYHRLGAHYWPEP